MHGLEGLKAWDCLLLRTLRVHCAATPRHSALSETWRSCPHKWSWQVHKAAQPPHAVLNGAIRRHPVYAWS